MRVQGMRIRVIRMFIRIIRILLHIHMHTMREIRVVLGCPVDLLQKVQDRLIVDLSPLARRGGGD